MGDSTADKFYRQGVELAQQKQYQAALSIFYESTQSDPNHEQAWVAKGVCQAHLKRYDEAYQSFKKALEMNPNNQQAKKNLEIMSPYISLPDIPMPDLQADPSNPKKDDEPRIDPVLHFLEIACGCITGLAIGLMVVLFLKSPLALISSIGYNAFCIFILFGIFTLGFHIWAPEINPPHWVL